MGKTIAQKSIELAEANADLTAKLAGVEAVRADLAGKLEAIQAETSALKASLAEKETASAAILADNETLKANAEAAEAEKAALISQVEQLSATLALNPQVGQSAGQQPVAAADVSEGAMSKPETWPQALAACGNDYVKARQAHPALFAAYFEQHKNDNANKK